MDAADADARRVLARDLLRGEQPNPALTDRRLCKEALDSIRRSFRAPRRAGAQYLLVNVPEHAFRWSGADGRERYASYLQALANLGDEEGFTSSTSPTATRPPSNPQATTPITTT